MSKTNIAWGLETTGFSAHSCQITAAGFYHSGAAQSDRDLTVYLNADGDTDAIDATVLSDALTDATGMESVSISVFESDRGLLRAMDRYTDNMEFRTERLVTYNGEKWTGGFALPFTRTRCVNHGLDWVFNNVPHLDLSESIQKRFNTQTISLETMSDTELVSFAEYLGIPANHTESTIERSRLQTRINEQGFSEYDLEAWAEEDANREVPTISLDTLVGSHGILLDCAEADAFDPYDDGGEAVIGFNNGAFRDLALHVAADLTRTANLASLLEEYVSDRYIEELRL